MSKKVTTESFIKEAIQRRGNELFDYSEVVYIKAKSPVLIGCRIHGTFSITPNNFLNGKGCIQCGKLSRSVSQQKTQESFINDANLQHENFYDYSTVVYQGAHKKIAVRCPKHDYTFQITPGNHLAGKGCKICGREKTTARFDTAGAEFITSANNYHNFKYDYSKVEYDKSNKRVTIICPIHKEFYQTPNRHLQSGCPACADFGFNHSKPAVLYIHKIVGGDYKFTGYGITRRPVGRNSLHKKNLNREGYTIIDSFTTEELDGKFIQKLEKVLIETFLTDPNTSHIEGFKRESTSTPYHEVVQFVTNYIEQHKETTWQLLT